MIFIVTYKSDKEQILSIESISYLFKNVTFLGSEIRNRFVCIDSNVVCCSCHNVNPIFYFYW